MAPLGNLDIPAPRILAQKPTSLQCQKKHMSGPNLALMFYTRGSIRVCAYHFHIVNSEAKGCNCVERWLIVKPFCF
jgi:hypothetical protein